MEVRVYGLGYVGLVTALGLAKRGLRVAGIEVSKDKVEELTNSRLHLYEPGLEDWFKSSLTSNRFTFDSVSKPSDSECFIAMVCVGTPMGARGKVDLSQLQTVLKSITYDLKDSITKKALLVIRSTVPPGTSLLEVTPIIEEILRTSNCTDVDYIFYPEFLREGQATKDFENPQISVMGTFKNSEEIRKEWKSFFEFLPISKSTCWVSVNSAEMMKYAQNSYNALRVSFANELATIATQFDVDTNELYQLMQLNQENEASGQYLRPGFSYGGPCLVKEVEALSWMGRKSGHELPLISNISRSNLNHFERFLSVIEQVKAKSILVLGVAFKPETDDLRNSFLVQLVEDLIERPSYKSQIKITILEKDEAQDKVSAYWSGNSAVTVASESGYIEESHDLVVFGSFKPDNKTVEAISKNCKQSIDLGFFENSADFDFK